MKKLIKNRWSGIVILFFLIAMFYGCNQEVKEENGSKPNIILFVADDHGTDALCCYGNTVIETPNLDWLADEGVRFTNAYCTSASCAASRSVILTGKYGHATGSYGHVHNYHHFSTYDTVQSLPVFLEDYGYLTARIGKYHLAPILVYHFQEVLEANPRNTVEMANECRDIINSDKPFFLYFCTDDPHRGAPFQPEPWNAPNDFDNREEGFPGVKTIEYDPGEVLVPDFLPDTKECREELAQYYQSVSRIDQGFGKLMEHLRESGKEENTIIIYISDNGIAFPGAKTTVYEPAIKLPCIIKTPELEKKGIVNDAMISWVDLTPTILDMAGIETEKFHFHGRSFNGILDQNDPTGWDRVWASHTFHEITMYYPMRAIRKDNMKLIWNIAYRLEYPFASDLWISSTWQVIHQNDNMYFGKRKVDDYLFRSEFELYDLEMDPDEINNLANSDEYQEILESLQQKLRNSQKETKDPSLIMWEHDASLQGSGVNL